MSYSKNPHLYPAWMKAAVEYYERARAINSMRVPFTSTREAQAMRFRFYAYIKLTGARGIKRAQIRIDGSDLVIEPFLDTASERRAEEAVFAQMTEPPTFDAAQLPIDPEPNFSFNGGAPVEPPPPTGVKLNAAAIKSMQEESDAQLIAMGFSAKKEESKP